MWKDNRPRIIIWWWQRPGKARKSHSVEMLQILCRTWFGPGSSTVVGNSGPENIVTILFHEHKATAYPSCQIYIYIYIYAYIYIISISLSVYIYCLYLSISLRFRRHLEPRGWETSNRRSMYVDLHKILWEA